MKPKEKITFLDLVIPLCFIYMSFLCGYTYFSKHGLEPNINTALVLFSCSFFFMYGVFAFIRDCKLFGIIWIIKSFRKLFKNDIDKEF